MGCAHAASRGFLASEIKQTVCQSLENNNLPGRQSRRRTHRRLPSSAHEDAKCTSQFPGRSSQGGYMIDIASGAHQNPARFIMNALPSAEDTSMPEQTNPSSHGPGTAPTNSPAPPTASPSVRRRAAKGQRPYRSDLMRPRSERSPAPQSRDSGFRGFGHSC